MIKERITPEHIQELGNNEIFVFGSNEDGFHKGGAARYAMDHFGAKWGQGEGLQGKSFAIPTMYDTIEKVGLAIKRFIEFARTHSQNRFLVTKIGCGIAGYTSEQIAPFFKKAIMVKNISLPESFWNVLKNK